MLQSYDDLVLEVATELELTTEEGNFIDIALKFASKSWTERCAIAGYGDWGNHFESDGSGGVRFALGKEVTFSIDLDVRAVLAGRDVKPEDVVSVLNCGNGVRSAEVVLKEFAGPAFRLSQREVVDMTYCRKYVAMVEAITRRHEEINAFVLERFAEYAEKQTEEMIEQIRDGGYQFGQIGSAFVASKGDNSWAATIQNHDAPLNRHDGIDQGHQAICRLAKTLGIQTT